MTSELVPKEAAPLASAVPGVEADTPAIEKYRGIAQKAFPKKVTEILQRPVKAEDVEIRPDGIIFLPQIKYRQRLNEALGAGAWALMPTKEEKAYETVNRYGDKKSVLVRPYILYVNGQFVSEATGQHRYEDGSGMQYGDVMESVKSDALTRCCKDLGIGSELFDPTFREAWKKEYAVQVTAKGKLAWRRKDRDPLPGEFTNDVPQDVLPPIAQAQPVAQPSRVVPAGKTMQLSKPGKVEVYGNPEGMKCSVCGLGLVVKKNGQYGEFYSCNRYPQCKTTFTWVKEPDADEATEVPGEEFNIEDVPF